MMKEYWILSRTNTHQYEEGGVLPEGGGAAECPHDLQHHGQLQRARQTDPVAHKAKAQLQDTTHPRNF
jgi:hypothetical protein